MHINERLKNYTFIKINVFHCLLHFHCCFLLKKYLFFKTKLRTILPPKINPPSFLLIVMFPLVSMICGKPVAEFHTKSIVRGPVLNKKPLPQIAAIPGSNFRRLKIDRFESVAKSRLVSSFGNTTNRNRFLIIVFPDAKQCLE